MDPRRSLYPYQEGPEYDKLVGGAGWRGATARPQRPPQLDPPAGSEGLQPEIGVHRVPITHPETGNKIGFFEFQIDMERGAVRARYPFIESDFQGQKQGVGAYKRLIDWSLERGLRFESDRNVSAQAAKVYDALERRGYTVIRSPDVEVNHQGAVSATKTGAVPFTITAPPAQ